MGFFFYKIVCFIPSGTEEVKKGEDTAVIKTEGKAPEFVLKIQTETVSCIDHMCEPMVAINQVYTDLIHVYRVLCPGFRSHNCHSVTKHISDNFKYF